MIVRVYVRSLDVPFVIELEQKEDWQKVEDEIYHHPNQGYFVKIGDAIFNKANISCVLPEIEEEAELVPLSSLTFQ